MKTFVLSSLLLSLAAAVPHLHPRAAKYDGYKVYRVDTGDKLEEVSGKLSRLNYEQWNRDISKHVDLSLSAEEADRFSKLGLDFKELHKNLGEDIAKEGSWGKWPGRKHHQTPGELPDLSWFDTYHDYEDHLEYLKELQEAIPKRSEIFEAGTSVEGRAQVGIHFWGKDGPGKKPAVLWHGTVHAREWITTMTVEYLTYQLILHYGKDPVITNFVDSYDFYVIPVINPDGFVYTQTTERLWRKSRLPPLPGANESEPCWGIDLNRNWPYMWDVNEEGSSPDPCMQTYRGAAPGDAKEMEGMAGFARKLGDSQGIKLFIDFHSYSQLILSPYGYSCEVFPQSNDQYLELMGATAQAIESVYGTSYIYGPTCQTIYPANGGSMDYIYDIVKGEWAMAMELRDTGEYGFILPPDQIVPTCEETWEGIKVMLSKV